MCVLAFVAAHIKHLVSNNAPQMMFPQWQSESCNPSRGVLLGMVGSAHLVEMFGKENHYYKKLLKIGST